MSYTWLVVPASPKTCPLCDPATVEPLARTSWVGHRRTRTAEVSCASMLLFAGYVRTREGEPP